MPDLPADLATAYARRIAARDNPPPPPPLSPEPAAVQARLEAWLLHTHGVRYARARQRLALALLALMQQPELETAALGRATGPPALAGRSYARLAGQLEALGLTSSAYRGLWRYHCLTRATEDALLLLLVGPVGPWSDESPEGLRPTTGR